MTDLMDVLHNVSKLGKPAREKQKTVNVIEVFYIWDIMIAKLDIMLTVRIMENFITEPDLKIISDKVAQGLKNGIDDMEELMLNYSIPFPARPPAGVVTAADIEYFTDQFIYQNLFEGVQAFFPVLSSAFMNSTSPDVRKEMREHLTLTMDLQELLVDYGKVKGYINEAPAYRA